MSPLALKVFPLYNGISVVFLLFGQNNIFSLTPFLRIKCLTGIYYDAISYFFLEFFKPLGSYNFSGTCIHVYMFYFILIFFLSLKSYQS